jgi:hypothetical protein
MEQQYFKHCEEGYLDLVNDTYYVVDDFGNLVPTMFCLHISWHCWEI